jgi:hypothetical protein
LPLSATAALAPRSRCGAGLTAAGRFDPRRIATRVAPFDAAPEPWLQEPGTKLVLERQS